MKQYCVFDVDHILDSELRCEVFLTDLWSRLTQQGTSLPWPQQDRYLKGNNGNNEKLQAGRFRRV